MIHMLQRTLPAGFIAPCLSTRTDKLPSKRVWLVSIWETLSHTTGRLNRTERTMRKTRNALLGILTMMSGAILAVPTVAAERYIPGVHLYKAVPERFFSFPYGASFLSGPKARSAIPTSTPTTGVTTPPSTTMEIIALPTIGNAGAIFLRSGRSPDWLKMKNPARRGRHHRDLDRTRELLVMPRKIGPVVPPRPV